MLMPVSYSNRHLQQAIHNAAKQLSAAYPSTVGVKKATTNQKWGITVGSEELFTKRVKRLTIEKNQNKTHQKSKPTRNNSDYQKLDG